MDYIIMTCLIHNIRHDNYKDHWESKYDNQYQNLWKDLSDEEINERRKSNSYLLFKNRYWPGPWRFNTLYGFLEIQYLGGNRLIGQRFVNYRNSKQLRKYGYFHKPGTFVIFGESTASFFKETNRSVIEAIQTIIQYEESEFKKQNKFLEYNKYIIENTNWLSIISHLRKSKS